MNFAHSLLIVLVTGRYTDVFRTDYFSGEWAGGLGYMRLYFHGGIYQERREFS